TSSSRTWHARGQNFALAYTELNGEATFVRPDEPDEHFLLIPAKGLSARIETDLGPTLLGGLSVTIVPPGRSVVQVQGTGALVHVFCCGAGDILRKSMNNASYERRHNNVAELQRWPEPVGGYRLRTYSLDIPSSPNRFGRIFQTRALMINFLDPWIGPRDRTRLSPHSHADFEQGSLGLEGEFVHHLRWPWTTSMADWREDEHLHCGSPSLTIIPPPSIHTTEATGVRTNQIVDIFAPPRLDFVRQGWVLNHEEYPPP
ncbi:MAG: hypothetical protein KGJ86_22195, partial [Chloroflexota bacterium]|nr:hypothetical protein [Chloroflexota bacterium]